MISKRQSLFLLDSIEVTIITNELFVVLICLSWSFHDRHLYRLFNYRLLIIIKCRFKFLMMSILQDEDSRRWSLLSVLIHIFDAFFESYKKLSVFLRLLFLFGVLLLITDCCGLKQIMKDVTGVLRSLEIWCSLDFYTSPSRRLLGHGLL
jgi:hypothetical protein